MNKPKRYRQWRVSQSVVDARDISMRLMREFGLGEWYFSFNGSKRMLGVCFFEQHLISLSVHFCELNPLSVIEDTMRHEIAHALVGPGHGHDSVWKKKSLEVGANPERCCSDCIAPTGAWSARCPNCQKCYQKYRKPKRMTGWYCPKCGTVKGELAWVEVTNPVDECW